MTEQTSIQMSAEGELVAFHQEGVSTYRFEKNDTEYPLVMLLHASSENSELDLEQFKNARVTITLEYEEKND